MAVQEIGRPWPAGTEINLISVELPTTTTELWAMPETYYSQLEESATRQANAAIDRAVQSFNAVNREIPLTLSTEIVVGRATETTENSAKSWDADLVVLDIYGKHGLERFLRDQSRRMWLTTLAVQWRLSVARRYEANEAGQ